MSEPNASAGATPASPLARAGVLFSRAVSKIRGLGKPAKILLVTTLVATIAIAGWFGIRAANEPYAVLFSQLSADDASSVVAKLKEMKVPYHVVDGGRIEVPEARVHELRLEIAGAGLPRGGGVGFESFDKMRLGATEFEQRTMYRRAMEGELTRTISTVSAVESARVHLVMPEKSVFVSRREPASASVVVKLRPGRELGAGEIQSIVHLVASAVPELTPDHVALATTEGVLLKKPRHGEGEDGDGGDEENQAEVHALENKLEERARTMLEKVVGPGHADVRVTADMDFSRVEHTEDHFEPKSGVLRSEELSVEKTQGSTDDTVAGVPGAESNLPTGDAPEPDALSENGQGVLRHEHTRNWEMNRVSEKRVSRTGTLKRIAVAVILDGVPITDDKGVTRLVQRNPVEIDRLTEVVRSAVGADERREDVVTVDSIPFALSEADLEAKPEVAAAPPPAKFDYKKNWKLLAAGAGALAFIVLIALVRRRRRRLLALREAPALTALQTANGALPEAVEVPMLDVRAEALRRAAEDPATAALVIRHWLGGSAAEEPEQRAA